MQERIQSIDAMRGMTIIGMIFCAAIGYGSGLPAWMFHCQVPPPDYVFHPEVRGITWVDLVFPFFIFSMGAAFPFALGKKIERKQKVIPGLLKRWITLVLFGLSIGNAQAARGCGAPYWLILVLSIAVWLGFFAALVRNGRRWLNPAGWALLAVLFAIEKYVLKVDLSLRTSDIIILILSTVALAGGLVWMLTKDNIRLRWLIWGALLALKAVDSYTHLLDWAELPYPIDCIINLDWLQYLLIAIPASIVGDMLMGGLIPAEGSRKEIMLPDILAAATVIMQLFFLFNRNINTDIILTISFFAAYMGITSRKRGTGNDIAYPGFALLIAGLFFDPLDGGIAKDYCNLSYLLVTCGMAEITASILVNAETRGKSFGFLGKCGQNPMIAYTIAWFVIEPLLYACGLMRLVDNLAEGSVLWGLMRGVLLTALMCLSTCLFSEKKLFWRS